MSIYGIDRLIHESHKDEKNRTINGVSFNRSTYATKMQSDSNYKMSQSFAQGRDSVGTTSFGKDIIDSQIQSRIESFDKQKTEQLLESENLVEEYNTYIDGKIDDIMDLAERGMCNTKDGNVVIGLTSIASDLLDEGFTKEEISDYLKGTYFYTSDNATDIKLLLNLRLRYCNHIINLLQKMVVDNRVLFELNDEELKEALKGIEDLDSGTIQGMKAALMMNKDKFYKDGIMDLTSLGGGKIYLSLHGKDNLVGTIENFYAKQLGVEASNEDQVFDNLLQKSFKYKAIIDAHGSTRPIVDMDNSEEEMERVLNSSQAADFMKLCNTYGISKKAIYDWYIKDYNNRIWCVENINANGNECFIVDFAIASIYLRSNKKQNTFLLCTCNTGNHKVHPVFNRIPGFKITYSDVSNFVESGDSIDLDDIESAINESEDDLRCMAESYGLNYDSVEVTDEDVENLSEYGEMLQESMLITEGKFTSALKSLAKKIVQTIIGLFKKLWEIVKKLFNKIKDFFKTKIPKSSKKRLDKPMNVSVITLESAGTKEYKVKSREELQRIALDSIKRLQNEIGRVQNAQVKATQELDKLVEKDK